MFYIYMSMKYCVAVFLLFVLLGCVEKHNTDIHVKQMPLPPNYHDLLGYWQWYKTKYYRDSTLHLSNLIADKDSIHIRFWNDRGSVVDIWSADGNTFNGIVTSYVDTFEEAAYNGYPTITRFLKDTIDVSLAKHIFNEWQKIAPLADKEIKGWKYGIMDGICFSFEITTPSFYKIESYCNPALQVITQGKLVTKVINNIDSDLALTNRFGRLYDSLKPGMYFATPGYLGSVIKTPDNSESKNLKKHFLNRLHDSSYYYSSQ